MPRKPRVAVRKDGLAASGGRPWSVYVTADYHRPVVQMHFATGVEALAWAGFLADPLLAFARIWDDGLRVGQSTPFGWDIYGPPPNPYRLLARRRDTQ